MIFKHIFGDKTLHGVALSCKCSVARLTLAAIRPVVPVSRGALSAVGAVHSGLTGARSTARVTQLNEGRRGVTVAVTTAQTRVEAKCSLLKPE